MAKRNRHLGKSALVLALAAAMLIGFAPTAAFAASGYADVSSAHWAHSQIERWSGDGYGVLQGADDDGDGVYSFMPSKGLTLAELATILSKTFGYVERTAAVVTPAWADEHVEKAIAAGVVVKADIVDASAFVTREQAVKYAALAYGIEPMDGETPFADDADIGAEFKGYVKALRERGFIEGKPGGVFDPQGNYTRAEALTVLDNATSEIADASVAGQTYEKDLIVRKSGVTVKDTTVKGDLIIGQGVGDGEVTLDGVTVSGRLIAYGGGSESIIISGRSNIRIAISAKTGGEPLRFRAVGDDVKLETIETAEGTTTIVTGNVQNLVVEGGSVEVLDGRIDNVTMTEAGDALKVAEGSTVQNLDITASASGAEAAPKVTVEGATVGTINASARADITLADGADVGNVNLKAGAESAKVDIGAGADVKNVYIGAENASLTIDKDASVVKAVVEANGASVDSANAKTAIVIDASVTDAGTIKADPKTVTNESSASVNVTDASGKSAAVPAGAKGTTGSSTGGGGGSSNAPAKTAHTVDFNLWNEYGMFVELAAASVTVYDGDRISAPVPAGRFDAWAKKGPFPNGDWPSAPLTQDGTYDLSYSLRASDPKEIGIGFVLTPPKAYLDTPFVASDADSFQRALLWSVRSVSATSAAIFADYNRWLAVLPGSAGKVGDAEYKGSDIKWINGDVPLKKWKWDVENKGFVAPDKAVYYTVHQGMERTLTDIRDIAVDTELGLNEALRLAATDRTPITETTENGTITHPANVAINIRGSFALASDVTVNAGTFVLGGNSNFKIDLAGKTVTYESGSFMHYVTLENYTGTGEIVMKAGAVYLEGNAPFVGSTYTFATDTAFAYKTVGDAPGWYTQDGRTMKDAATLSAQ
jgi:hypothetical protein